MIRFIILFFLCWAPFADAALSSFAAKFEKAQDGDYIVTKQDKTCTLIFVRAHQPFLLLEEISVLESSVTTNWKQWLAEGAPGHTSWNLYEFDLESGKLNEAFSFSHRGWLTLGDDEQILAKLLTLPLNKVPEDKRRRIGPPPLAGESDTRKLWNPPKIFEGKTYEKSRFQVLGGRWPQDRSLLSGCAIEMYFDAQSPFPFPFWIELSNGHYTLKLRVVDAGKGLKSPQKLGMPHRPPQFVGQMQKEDKYWRVTLKSPHYYHQFKLYALDLSKPTQPPMAVPFELIKSETAGVVTLSLDVKQLRSLLKEGHPYRWMLVPERFPDVVAESHDLFVWKNS